MGQCKSLMRGPEIPAAVPKFHIPPILGPLHLTDDLVTAPDFEWEEFEPVLVDWSLVNGLVPFSIKDRNCILQSNGQEFQQLDTSQEILETFKGSPDNLGLGISRNQTVELVHNDNLVVDESSLTRLRNAIDFWNAFQPSQDALDRLSKYPDVFTYVQAAADGVALLAGDVQRQQHVLASSTSTVSEILGTCTASEGASSDNLPTSRVDVATSLPPESSDSSASTSTSTSTSVPDYEIVIKPRYKTPGYPIKEYSCITRMHPPSVPEREHPLWVQDYIIQCIGDFLDPYQVDRLKRQNKLSLLLNEDNASLFGRDLFGERRGRRHVNRASPGHDAKKRMLLVNRAPNKMCSLSSLETIDEYPEVPLEQRVPDFATLCQQAARVFDETCCVTQGPHGPFTDALAIRTVLKDKFGDWSDVPLL